MSAGARRETLIDADAFNCFRSLGLLAIARQRTGFRVLLTSFVARHDLAQLGTDVKQLESSGCASVHALPASDKELRRLVRDGVDRGEAEAIAWALARVRAERPVFVSNDRLAREHARREKVPTADLLDFVVELIEQGILTEAEASGALATWDDRKQQQCRPKDWAGFKQSVAARRGRDSLWT